MARSMSTALLGLEAAAEDDMHNRLSHHEMEGEAQHDHDDFESFVVSLGADRRSRALIERIKQVIIANMTFCG